MKTYSHTQRAGRWLWIPGTIGLVLAVIGVWTRVWAVLAGILVLLALVWMFGSLSVEITGGRLNWRFGSGLIRRSVPVDSIAEVRVVRTTWIEGWGIHYTQFGWLYNVAGFEAVAFRLKDGKKFAVGTDDPVNLVMALNPSTAAA